MSQIRSGDRFVPALFTGESVKVAIAYGYPGSIDCGKMVSRLAGRKNLQHKPYAASAISEPSMNSNSRLPDKQRKFSNNLYSERICYQNKSATSVPSATSAI
ncbi:hypothetical protein [Hymenobacter amundsenii]|uniref:hypothetical protein n=1 Tax=Hymenobacter amundsenii TaxID=2006685 RepID=UPI000F819DF6|nr:hypothetical protein [Hymenobacter amundsenii]